MNQPGPKAKLLEVARTHPSYSPSREELEWALRIDATLEELGAVIRTVWGKGWADAERHRGYSPASRVSELGLRGEALKFLRQRGGTVLAVDLGQPSLLVRHWNGM